MFDSSDARSDKSSILDLYGLRQKKKKKKRKKKHIQLYLHGLKQSRKSPSVEAIAPPHRVAPALLMSHQDSIDLMEVQPKEVQEPSPPGSAQKAQEANLGAHDQIKIDVNPPEVPFDAPEFDLSNHFQSPCACTRRTSIADAEFYSLRKRRNRMKVLEAFEASVGEEAAQFLRGMNREAFFEWHGGSERIFETNLSNLIRDFSMLTHFPWSLILLTRLECLASITFLNTFLILGLTFNVLVISCFIQEPVLWIFMGVYAVVYDSFMIGDIVCPDWVYMFLSILSQLKTNNVTSDSFHWVLPILCILCSMFSIFVYLLSQDLDSKVSIFAQSFALALFFYLCFVFLVRTLTEPSIEHMRRVSADPILEFQIRNLFLQDLDFKKQLHIEEYGQRIDVEAFAEENEKIFGPTPRPSFGDFSDAKLSSITPDGERRHTFDVYVDSSAPAAIKPIAKAGRYKHRDPGLEISIKRVPPNA